MSMGYITRVNISGFKAIESGEFDPGGINIITGPNNSGKTSLLESILLCLDPHSMHRYTNNISSLVRKGSDTSTIQIKTGSGDREVKLYCPDTDETLSISSDLIKNRINNKQIIERVGGPYEETEFEELLISIKEVINRYMNSLADEDIAELRDAMLIVELDGIEYPYINTRRWYHSVIQDHHEELTETVIQELSDDNTLLQEQETIISELIEEVFERSFRMHRRGSGYLDKKPDSKSVSFIQDPIIENRRPPFLRSDDDSVKKVRVRKYLQNREILEDLEDFDFDELVFNREGQEIAIPYEFMGDGLKTIVGIVWQLAGDDKIADTVLMEEPENHLHPGYINELVPFLIQFAREEETQLFITTHNIDFISEFFSDSILDENEEYLTNELKLIQMGGLVPKQFDFTNAQEQIEDIHNDLRGI